MKIFSVRLEKDTLKELKETAKREKTTKAKIIRRALSLYTAQSETLLIDLNLIFNELYDLKSNLSRVGGNLNQIARHLNMGTAPELAELEPILNGLRNDFKKIANILNVIINALGKFL